MELRGGKSYDDGIDFSVKDGKKRYVVCARRNSNGEVETTIKNGYEWVESRSFRDYIICAVLSVLITLTCFFFKNQTTEIMKIIGWLIVLGIIWVALIVASYLDSKDPKKVASARYHSAEHKVLNYYHKYSRLPQSTFEIANRSSVYVICGSTVIVVILLFGSLSLISVVAFPFIILKILGVIASMVGTFYLWVHGKCNFIQKFYLKPPTEAELELAICAMKKLAEDENVV